MGEIGDRFQLFFEATMELFKIVTDVVSSVGTRAIACLKKFKQVFTGRKVA
jgi:hypothetical protein